jgi:hypothetical protein
VPRRRPDEAPETEAAVLAAEHPVWTGSLR